MRIKELFTQDRWAGVGGPLLTAATAVVLLLLSRMGASAADSSSILVLVVVYSAFAGGLRPGLASSAVALLYFAVAFSRESQLFRYDAEELERFVVLGAVTPAIVLMVGVLHRRSTDQVARRLAESEQRFQAFMNHSPALAWVKDADGRFVYVNTPFELTFNVSRNDLIGQADGDPWSQETRARIAGGEREVLLTGKPRQLYESLHGRDGALQHWWILQFPVEGGPGQTLVGAMAVDMTERREAEQALRESEERYALAAQSVNDGLWDWDLKTNEVYFSKRWKELLGHEEGEIGKSPFEWFRRVHPDDLAPLQAKLQDHLEGKTPTFESEHRMRHRDRGYRWFLTRGVAVRTSEGKPYRMVGAQADITQRKLAEEQLIHDALHDALTGLPNRSLFLDRLTHRLRHARREKDRAFAVLFLDLDRFKMVNDSLGHGAGDEMLVESARRLERAVRPGDTVARLGGDEFAVLLEDVGSTEDSVRVAERIQTFLRAPMRVGIEDIVSTASIGIAMGHSGYEKAEEVLRDADTAMYRAKSDGRARHAVFDSEMHARAVMLLQIENELRQAVERKEFEAWYMPVVSLAHGRIWGFEALVRWRHPQRGIVPPMDFVGIAEDAGLIIPMDRQVMLQAWRQLKEWRERFPDGDRLVMGVNLSVKQFRHADLVDHIRKVIEEEKLPPGSLAVEITENVLIDNSDRAGEMLRQLRALGVLVYLDDFGTGYSSLSYLQRFPIDAVKIDRSFVNRMSRQKGGSEIVRAIISLSHSLGMKVIAEGVETLDHLGDLRLMKCGYGQGMLFSKPIPADEAGLLLAEEPRW